MSDDDVKELFSSVGRIRESGVHYDKTGRSKGTAHVVFESAADAFKAFEKYNNGELFLRVERSGGGLMWGS